MTVISQKEEKKKNNTANLQIPAQTENQISEQSLRFLKIPFQNNVMTRCFLKIPTNFTKFKKQNNKKLKSKKINNIACSLLIKRL